jgi:hypothetical protein
VTAPDVWHHYGRVRSTGDRAVPGTFRWNWAQDGGPGAEILGDLAGRYVGDLGAGAAGTPLLQAPAFLRG